MGCKVTFSPWLCLGSNPAFGLAVGHRYWISDQVFKFTAAIVQRLEPAEPEPPSIQPGPIPIPHEAPGGDVGIGQQVPDTGPGPFPHPQPRSFIGRIIAYPYIEIMDRGTLEVPTYAGHRYLTYEVCELDCNAGGGSGISACCDFSGLCTDLPYDDCVALGGGVIAGRTCAEAEAESWCYQMGACCLPGGGCINTLHQCCGGILGDWRGQGSTCLLSDCSPVGACCRQDAAGCIEVTQSECLGYPSGQWAWAGPGTSCDGDCQNLGACCGCDQGPPIAYFWCYLTTQASCLAGINTTWNGAATCEQSDCATPCVPNPYGACCRIADPENPSGFCEDLVAPEDCTSPDIFFGLLSQCRGPDCGNPSACCYGPLLDQCFIAQDQAACDDAGGIFHPGWDCSQANNDQQQYPGPCRAVCCEPNGTCQYHSQPRCDLVGGIYMPDEPTCSGFDCGPGVTGSCCLPSNEFGHCNCEPMPELPCTQQGGTWLPDPPFQNCEANSQAAVRCQHASTPGCDGPCGTSPFSCHEDHGTPGCNNELCCLCICSFAPECCGENSGWWDDFCVSYVQGGIPQCDPVCNP